MWFYLSNVRRFFEYRSGGDISTSAGGSVESTSPEQHGHSNGGRFFDQAHDFTLNNPQMIDFSSAHVKQVIFQTIMTSDATTERLIPFICQDAAVNASARYPLPRCHKGTREKIVEKLRIWFHDPELRRKIMWLYGPAGTGKSAVAQTFAEYCEENGCLGSTFFFSRPNHRDRYETVIPTIAYQLATTIPSYRVALTRAMANDTTILAKTPQVQLKKLIVEPFTALHLDIDPATQKRLLIVLDGLDECHGLDGQLELIEMIKETAQVSYLPFLWLICSRPEPHLTYIFSKVMESDRHQLVIDADTRRDVTMYLRDGFIALQGKYWGTENENWPPLELLTRIVDIADGLFVLATAILGYIGNPSYAAPNQRLLDFLAFMDHAHRLATDNPLVTLDLLYSRILLDVPTSVMPVTRRILHHCVYVIDPHGEPPSAQVLANFLCLDQQEFYHALRSLHSVLEIPTPEDAINSPLCMYHASFKDYLCSPSRAGKFFISEEEAKTEFARSRFHWYDIILEDHVLDDQFTSDDEDAPQSIVSCLKWASPISSEIVAHNINYFVIYFTEGWVYLFRTFKGGIADLPLFLDEFRFQHMDLSEASDFGDFPVFLNHLSQHGSSRTVLRTKAACSLDRLLLASVMKRFSKLKLSVIPMVFPLGKDRVGVEDDRSVCTKQSSSNARHLLSQHSHSEDQGHQVTSTSSSSAHTYDQHESLQPLDPRWPQPPVPSLPWNPPSHAQPSHTSNPFSSRPTLAAQSLQDSPHDANQPALVSQLLAPEYSPAHSSGPFSRNDIATRRQSRRPSPLSPRLKDDDPGGYSMERYHRDKGKGRLGANHSDDFHPRVYPVVNHQPTDVQSRSASIENGCVRFPQGLSNTTQAGLTEVHHHQPSLHPPTSTQTASLRGVATGTQEITSPNHTSLFSGSHDFAMHNPTFIVYPPGAGSQQLEHSAGMIWLKASMIEHAQHDSAGRDPPPRCHPDTRISILERTHKWINDPQRQKRLLWIRGPAGVGKSAIVQTVADSLSVSGRLIATLFFSRPNGRSNPQRVFPTIAYQLASQDSTYRAYIETIRPPDSLPLEAKAMKEQFRLLIVDPLAKHKLLTESGDVLIAIDGLDECDGDPGQDSPDQAQRRGRSLQQVHREIIELISGFVCAHPSIPIIWIIASRPESHITSMFTSRLVKDSYAEESISVDDEEARQDVEKFLTAAFEKIADAYPDHITITPWPTYTQFLQIAQAASGLFIFAEVAIRFIDDSEVQNPVSQLGHVLAAVDKLRRSREPKNPLSALDVIYTAILDRIPPARMEDLNKLLPLVFHVSRKSIKVTDYKFRNMYEHFDISREDAITSFNYLHSVIYFPRVKDIGETQPRFYHASFRDYLEDPSRSGEHTVATWDANSTWPLPAVVIGSSDWSNLIKSKWLRKLFEALSSADPVVIDTQPHPYQISTGQLQDILDGLNFRSMLLENLENRSFRSLHQEATTKISCVDELKRRGVLRHTTLALFRRLPSDEIWTGRLNRNPDYVVFDYERSGCSDSVTEEHALKVRARRSWYLEKHVKD
ncbi:hypothetical protein NP233_g316 [Leucocoprinus birnbaumii]|uniref:NACHT domain-containing protein n=1 Tax=Leucocoprinus birnbaumii TaxID=56174 RepID=A0AAD5W3X8_9AGAR|nr:hypothetical protein NP233_g316 [Leucocoprinus birnbaumii]